MSTIALEGEYYSDISDFGFVHGNLEKKDDDWVLFVPMALPGGITVIDSNGYAVAATQREKIEKIEKEEGTYVDVCSGTYVIMTPFLKDGKLVGTWKIRYSRGPKGNDAYDGIVESSSEELMLYSIIFS